MSEPLDLDAIELACSKASPGPWTPDARPWPAGGAIRLEGGFMSVDGARGAADTTFIASARTWVPALVAEIKRLKFLHLAALMRTTSPDVDIANESAFEMVKREREACAKMVEEWGPGEIGQGPDVEEIAAAIRARGSK